MHSRTWAEIDLEALAANFLEVRRLVGPGIGIMPAVKADAYGHGAVPCARVLERLGADLFGVATVAEAAELRAAGLTPPSLILCAILPDEIDAALDCGAALSISDMALADAAARTALSRGIEAAVHLKVDTGMGRQGVGARVAVAAAEKLSQVPGIRLDGVFTHFPSADEEDAGFTNAQIERFDNILATIEERGINVRRRHAANSAAVIDHPASHLNMVRPGLMLYGARPMADMREGVALRPVMTLKSHIVLIKDIVPGGTLSYGRTFTATRPMRIGAVPAGYADGLSRRLSNCGSMIVRGTRVPIVGRVSMDQTLIDVSSVEGVAVGDEVVIYGAQGNERIRIEEVAERTGTIPNEVMCAVGARVPRVYVNDGPAAS